MNPLNRKDAIRIHSRLRDLGLFRGKNDTVWSDASRLAIREFKKKNGLQSDDNWDGNTENRLFAASP
jgi:peptidoglycan hydrolase-like protein with peptidoglycan-binding domain